MKMLIIYSPLSVTELLSRDMPAIQSRESRAKG